MLPTTQRPQRCLIPIQIETLAGTSFELLVSPHEQIQYIKRKIERREGIPISHQHLIWNSTELDDQSCLNDHNIGMGTTIKLVLAMRGGPVNTRRVPIEDGVIRDMSDYIEHSRDDGGNGSDVMPSTNKNVTFLVLRDGDQFNFFQVIDRGDGTLSPLSGSMYNTHEPVTVKPDREYDEKRQADDQKTKEKMEFLRSKMKTETSKEIVLPSRPASSTRSNVIHHHHHRGVHMEATSNSHGDNLSGVSSIEQEYRPLSYKYPTGNPFHALSTSAAHRIDSLDEDDNEPPQQQQQQQHHHSMFATRSYSPTIYYQKNRHHRLQRSNPSRERFISQEATTPVTHASDRATRVEEGIDCSLAIKCPPVADESTAHATHDDGFTDHLDASAVLEYIDDVDEEADNGRKLPADPVESQPTTSPSAQRADENTPDEQIRFSASVLAHHRTSSAVPTLPSLVKHSGLPFRTHHFSHHSRPSTSDEQQSTGTSSRSFAPLSLSKYRRLPVNAHLRRSSSARHPTVFGSSTDSLHELTPSSITNDEKRTDVAKPAATILSSPTVSRRIPSQQPVNQLAGTTTTISSTPAPSRMRLDSTKVTIETIGSRAVSALLRPSTTIEPVDTSRGVGKHLVSLLTTASHEPAIDEHYQTDTRAVTEAMHNLNKLPTVTTHRKSTSKCFLCKKKTGLATTYQCRCGSSFCSEHRYPEAHACAFDYKAEGKRLIERNNPLVSATKLPKI